MEYSFKSSIVLAAGQAGWVAVAAAAAASVVCVS